MNSYDKVLYERIVMNAEKWLKAKGDAEVLAFNVLSETLETAVECKRGYSGTPVEEGCGAMVDKGAK